MYPKYTHGEKVIINLPHPNLQLQTSYVTEIVGITRNSKGGYLYVCDVRFLGIYSTIVNTFSEDKIACSAKDFPEVLKKYITDKDTPVQAPTQPDPKTVIEKNESDPENPHNDGDQKKDDENLDPNLNDILNGPGQMPTALPVASDDKTPNDLKPNKPSTIKGS